MRPLDKNEAEALEMLLQHELRFTARTLRWTDAAATALPSRIAATLLNCAERDSRALDDASRRRCLTICSLLWEHRTAEWRALAPLLVYILNRIGLAPSSEMIRDVNASGLGSLRLEIETTVRQLEHQVSLSSDQTLLLSTFQKRLWDALQTHRYIGVSAPTSAGKSFVLVHHAVQVAKRGQPVLYVVPTISLIQQVSADVRRYAKEQAIADLLVLQTVPTQSAAKNVVYVLTQERALAALSRSTEELNAALSIIDEVQNLERVATSDNERAHTLRDVLRTLIDDRRTERLVLSGARVKNIDALVKALVSRDAVGVSDEVPPVVNVAYAVSKHRKTLALGQYTGLDDKKRLLTLSRPPANPGLGGRRYTPRILAVLADMTEDLASQGVLVFSPTSGQASTIAESLAGSRPKSGDARLVKLAEYVRESVHRNYSLAGCVESGVGYHHGKVPPHLRLCVEIAMRQRILRTVACTTTLMQGVNLPAKTIIARNPDLFVRRTGSDAAQLSGYEFANLRGRAGRLMEDFVGRAIVLDESAFEDAGISVGELPEKEVPADVSDRFVRFRDEVRDGLLANRAVNEGAEANDLVLLVRRTVLKYRDSAIDRLKRVGVELSAAELRRTEELIDGLSVPLDICLALPFWDPVVLDSLYLNRTACAQVPTRPFARDFVDSLKAAIGFIETHAPYYRQKYLDAKTDREITGICIAAQQWVQEQPLRLILERNDNAEIDADEVNRRVSIVIQNVSHDVPKLLRPIVLMQHPENALMSFMEYGAYKPATRALIDLGIPREVACRLVGLSRTAGMNELSRNEIVAAAASASPWEREQLRAVLVDDRF